MKSSVLATTASALNAAFATLSGIASEKGVCIKTVSVNVKGTDLTGGVVKGTVTVANRSRRPYSLKVQGEDVNVTFLGQTRKVA